VRCFVVENLRGFLFAEHVEVLFVAFISRVAELLADVVGEPANLHAAILLKDWRFVRRNVQGLARRLRDAGG
jgi:hypothetical protein